MRNPLKKLQKKINLRLATHAAQNSAQQRSGASPPKPKSSPDKLPNESTRSLSATSFAVEQDDDPLFNERILRRALAESKKGNHQQLPKQPRESHTSPTKKKGGRRISFGGSRNKAANNKGSSLPEQLPLTATADSDEAANSSPSKGSFPPQKAPRTPPKSNNQSTPKASSPSSPSSNSHIPAPPTYSSSFESPTKSSQSKMRDKADMPSYAPAATATTASRVQQWEAGVAVQTPPRPSVVHKKVTAKHIQSQQHQQQRKIPPQGQDTQRAHDPALDRIAKAAAALDHTGNQMFEKGDYDKAMAHYVKALKLKNRTLGTAVDEEGAGDLRPNRLDNAMTSDNTQPSTHTTNEQEKQLAARGKGVPTTQPSPAPEGGADDLWISVATSINNIGYLRQQSGQASAEETMQAYQNSLQIKRRVLGKDNLSVGKTLNNLGTVHYLKREYDQALLAYREALQIMMSSLGPHHLDVGTVHSNIGDVFWAQSGESSSVGADGQPSCPQESYQASRNAALRHYRQSLEIRWEELQDHHDPKVIRLLEKIAALEMGDSFLALVQSSHKHRRSPKAAEGGTPRHADESLEAESGSPLVQQELHTLHAEVREDVKNMDRMERKMAIDMVKDKLRLIREMKKLSSLNIYGSFDDEESLFGGESVVSPSTAVPLSPVQRAEALSAVKERLQVLRESRTKEDVASMRRHNVPSGSSDLKEADGSPTNYFLSHRASQILNRTLQPSSKMDSLDELRKFTFNEEENNPSGDAKESKEAPDRSFAVSPRASNALGEGIDALRSLSINQDNRHSTAAQSNPWLVATSAGMAKSPKKSVLSPTTPLAAASMAAF